jgi:predicted DNA-binding transcriptional regulator AlpA
LRADRAAAYLDISKSLFLELVSDGKMPQPRRLRGAPRWDRLEIEAAWDQLMPEDKTEGTPPPRENTIDKILGFDRNAPTRDRPKD